MVILALYWSATTHLDGPNPYSGAAYVAFGEALGMMNYVLMDVHGAGAQRSDPKTGDPTEYPQYKGPQGDLQMVYNHARCVRTLDETYSVIEEPKKSGINFFPNPTENVLNLNLLAAGYSKVHVKLYDINSKLFIDKELSGSDTTLDVSSLPEGVYFIVGTMASSEAFYHNIRPAHFVRIIFKTEYSFIICPCI